MTVVFRPDNYKNLPPVELRALCAFKDGTIEMQQQTLDYFKVQLRETEDRADKAEMELLKVRSRINEAVYRVQA